MNIQSITLSTGYLYTPAKGEPPVSPCHNCKEQDLSRWGECNSGFGVCPAYMDYEHMNAVYRTAVFD